MEYIADRLFRYRDKLRKQKRKSWWERAKPYLELSLTVIFVILLILCAFFYFYYQSLYSL